MGDDETKVAKDLLKRGAAEIEQLRREVERLEGYRRHTERMLALFEGGPRMEGHGGEAIDVAWELRMAAQAVLEPETPRG